MIKGKSDRDQSGPSGGGKSTLLRCLNYLDSFDTGEVEIAGIALRPGMDTRDGDQLRTLRTRVGMVFPAVQPVPAPHRAREHHALAPRVVRKAC